MSKKRNREHLAIESGVTRGWILEIGASANGFERQREEAADLHGSLHECLGEIFSPKSVDYQLQTYEGTVSDVRETAFPSMDANMIIEGDTGWRTESSAQSQLQDILTEECPVTQCQVYQLETRGKTFVRLTDGDHWVNNEDTERVREYKRDQERGIPKKDPFETEIKYRKGFGEEGNVNDVYYEVSLRTYTDIWAEDTELGTINRGRLLDAFRNLRNQLDIQTVISEFENNHDMGATLAEALAPPRADIQYW